jgi:hypothetical protein
MERRLLWGGERHGHYPDGLTEEVIDSLLAVARRESVRSSRPSGALLDGSAASRRERRMERREAAAVVRALPVRRPVSGGRGVAA